MLVSCVTCMLFVHMTMTMARSILGANMLAIYQAESNKTSSASGITEEEDGRVCFAPNITLKEEDGC